MLSKPYFKRIHTDGETYGGHRDPPGQSSVYIPPGDVWTENYRLATFLQFPEEVPVIPSRLAASGFYYTGFRDRVKCFSCGICVENWILGDSATDKQWHRNDCDFAYGRDTTNQPLLGRFIIPRTAPPHQQVVSNLPSTPMRRNTHVISSGNYVQETIPASLPQMFRQSPPPIETVNQSTLNAAETASTSEQSQDTPYPCNAPVNPEMESVIDRLETFKSRNGIQWPRDCLRAGIDELANAGFYYLGQGDRVKCWYCNGGLQNWNYNDNPWTEHAKWYPSCQYLLRTKGLAFVQSVSSSTENVPSRSQQTVAAASQNGSISLDAVEHAMSSLGYIPQVKEMGYTEDVIKAVLKRKYEANGQFHDTGEEFIEALLYYALRDDPPRSAATSQSSSASSQPCEGSLNKLREIEESRLCKVCRKQVANVVLIPCGHLSCCDKCTGGLRKCPICHRVVQDTIKTFRA